MDISTHFDQEALSDVILHVRSTSDDHARIDPDSRKRPRPEDGPASERSFYLHKIILFQSPYFEKLHGWKAGCASAPDQASSDPHAPSLPGAAEEHDQASTGHRVLPPPSEEPADALAELHVRPLPGKTAEPLEPAAAPSASCAAPPIVDKACLERAVQTVLAGAAYAARAELIMHVKEGELEAVELLLKCLYKVELPEVTRGNGQLLLQVYCLEDKYKIPAACMEPVLAALSTFQAKDIDLTLLSHVYSLPDQLLDAPSLQKLATACKQKLVELFGDVPAVITDLEQRQQFCALPHAAVLAWLQSDDLKVHSESCVVFLLSAWVNSKEHPACSSDGLKQLAHGVRVAHLSDVYWLSVLPDLEWFMGSCDNGNAGFLRSMQLQELRSDAEFGVMTGPPAWSSEQRKGTALPASADLAWKLGPHNIKELDDAASQNVNMYSPDSTYFNGIFYRLNAQKHEAENHTAAVTLGLYLCPYVQALKEALGFWDCARQPCFYSGELWASTTIQMMDLVVSNGGGRGTNDILGVSAATIAEVVAPFLVDGWLSLKAVIKRHM